MHQGSKPDMDRELTQSIRVCLAQLERGESVDACLAIYPERAAELEPLLLAAQQLRALRPLALPQSVRLRHSVMLSEALASARSPILWGIRRFALAGFAVLVACFVLAGTAVAASRPGDPAYAWRVAVEQVPARLQPSASARADAELAVADRRLQDLETRLKTTAKVDPVALAALQAEDQQLAHTAERLAENERTQLAVRVREQGRRLSRLAADAADPQAAYTLRQAAAAAETTAVRMGLGPAGQPGPRRNANPGAEFLTPAATVTQVMTVSATAGPSTSPGAGEGPAEPGPGDGIPGNASPAVPDRGIGPEPQTPTPAARVLASPQPATPTRQRPAGGTPEATIGSGGPTVTGTPPAAPQDAGKGGSAGAGPTRAPAPNPPGKGSGGGNNH
jgi:hypothetical protein